MTSGERLADFSRAVRDSTLKRLRKVHPGDEEWRPAPDALAFVDIARHLVDADLWILEYLRGKSAARAVISPGMARGFEWTPLLSRLVELREERAGRLESMSEDQLQATVIEPQVLGETTYWWLVLRGNLDHEIHHRGALQLALRLRYPTEGR